ncbi:hypothetical protein JCM8097_009186 [Rhodosporidiobolus ruineniae]
MLRRLPSLFLLLAAVVVLASSPAVALNSGNSTTPGFQLDLSKRFTSTVSLLKSRRGPTKTSKNGLERKRSLSDELLAMLKSAATILSPSASAHPSASASAVAKARPSASAAASAWASHAAAASKPSGSLQPSSVKAAKANVEYVKRKIQEAPWETLDSRLLCPIGETACPIFPRMGTYECIDTATQLDSCGGCLSKGDGEDCSMIKGAQGVTCESGGCFVYQCQPGYKLDTDHKRPNGGKGRCRKMLPPNKERRSILATAEAALELEKREAAAPAAVEESA